MLSEYHLLKKTNRLRNHVGFELDTNSDMRSISELQNQRLVLLAVRRVLITERFRNHSTGEKWFPAIGQVGRGHIGSGSSSLTV